MEYRKRLNPERSLRTPKGIKGTRQKVIVTHNPSEIDQPQELLVRFPDLCISQFQAPTSPRATPGVLHSTAAPGPGFILDDLPRGPGFCISIKLRLVQ